MKRFAQISAWLVVVVAATTLTWQIVSAADEQISPGQVSPLNVAAPQLQAAATTTTSPVTTSTAPTASSATVTTVPADTTTTTETTNTTSPSVTTPTTTSQWMVKTTTTAGGVVTVKYRPGEVVFQTASPAVGFRAELEKSGPPEVDVKFESQSAEIEYHAKWEAGQLKIEVSGSDHD